MNAEVYFIKELGLNIDIDAAMKEIIYDLSKQDINVIFKTVVEPTEENLHAAFEETSKSSEKIDLILIIGGLYNKENSFIKSFFAKKGIYLDYKKFSSNVEILSPQSVQIPGYAIKLKNMNIICIPSTNQDMIKVLRGSVVPYLLKLKNCQNESSVKAENIITPKKKKNFFIRWFIPWKGDGFSEVIRKIIFTISVIALIFSMYKLVDFYIVRPYLNDKQTDQIKEIYYSNDAEGLDDENRLKKFESLLAVNQDIKGWITIPNTLVDYPVLQPSQSDPEYYLYRNYERKSTSYGSIFMDSICKLGINSKNIILHGHHMNDGRMFAGILKYSDLTFYNNNPVFTFDGIYEEAKWKVISVFKTNTLPEQGEPFQYLIADFANDSNFLNYVHQVKSRSLIYTPVDVNEDDYLVTLSTCSYEFKDFRTVVVARKVRNGESEEVDVSKAKVASNPLMPDIWYVKHGGTKPIVNTFQKDLQDGKIDWYNPNH